VSTAQICNVHVRRIAADPTVVWDLLMAMSGPSDRLWPPGIPLMRFDGPLAVGAQGRHGPIHYTVAALDPTAGNLVLRFREPTGLVGHHAFRVRPRGETGAVLRHEVVADPRGSMRLQWPLIIRWIHDAVVEEILDRAEVAVGHAPAQPYQRSRWVRSLLTLGATVSRTVRVLSRPWPDDAVTKQGHATEARTLYVVPRA
jgi:hypothetical protein